VVQQLHGSSSTLRWAIKLILNITAVLFVAGSILGINPLTIAAGQTTEPKAGGNCIYNRYRGRADILSIRPKMMPEGGAPSYETREVIFSFCPDEQISESWVQVEGKRYLLTLANGWYPGPAFLNKYGIDIGRRLDCEMAVITSGTCTPIQFDFPTIDLADYFEHEK
jgi:hypothetical protein